MCKVCHAREHGLLEPSDGWILLSIDDLGVPYGICEKKGCGTEIRYEHQIYHPKYGYLSVGSTCVEYLTQEDRHISSEILKTLKKISDFINDSNWEVGVTKKRKLYYFSTFSHHQIRIYGKERFYSFQIALKIKGEKWFQFGDFIDAKNKNLEQVKELSFIVLKGTISEDEKEKEILRNIYRRIK